MHAHVCTSYMVRPPPRIRYWVTTLQRFFAGIVETKLQLKSMEIHVTETVVDPHRLPWVCIIPDKSGFGLVWLGKEDDRKVSQERLGKTRYQPRWVLMCDSGEAVGLEPGREDTKPEKQVQL